MDKSVYSTSILLIGPIGVCKKMIAAELSKKTGLPSLSLNRLRRLYYPKYGYNKEYAAKLKREQGLEAWYEYQKPFEKALIIEFLNIMDKPCIVDVGAGFTVYKNKQMFNEVSKAFSPFKNVFNLELPTSYKTYNKTAAVELNQNFKQNNCNYSLATFNVSVDLVNYNGKEHIFSEEKFKAIINNILTVSGVKRIN